MSVGSTAREDRLLHGPVLPVLARLAAPNVLAMTAAAATSIAETTYVGILGRDSLAAMAIAFPLAMLMQMLSGGAMGGGVSSAISRALGAGDVEGAQSLARHAIAIGAFAGLGFALLFALFADAIFQLMGARGAVLGEVHRYGMVFFAGIAPLWLANMMLSVIRGTGDMRVPATAVLATAAGQVMLGAVFGLGLGPAPRLGLAGVALGQLIAATCGCVVLAAYLRAPARRVRLTARGWQLRRAHFWQILRVGLPASLSPVQSVLSVLVTTALIARLGVDALAGFGIGTRLEFIALPIAFGIGAAALPMVGMAVGRGDVARARRVAWVGGGVSAAITGAIGLVVAAWPSLWAGLFTAKPEVLAACESYLRHVGPAYALFGGGLTLYFASQGAGKVLGPVLAGTARLAVILLGGLALTRLDAPGWTFFALASLGMVTYGVCTAWAVLRTPWEPRH